MIFSHSFSSGNDKLVLGISVARTPTLNFSPPPKKQNKIKQNKTKQKLLIYLSKKFVFLLKSAKVVLCGTIYGNAYFGRRFLFWNILLKITDEVFAV